MEVFPTQIWRRAESAVFCKTREEFGGLSNMAGGYPLKVGLHVILSSEALYQACRFPLLPDVQKRILDQKSPMSAKMVGKPFRNQTRPGWDEGDRVTFMRWALAVKLAQNWERFGELLLSTVGKRIVEFSPKGDTYWGAVYRDGDLVGQNVLGVLLEELRDRLVAEDPTLLVVYPPELPDCFLLGDDLPMVRAIC